MKKSPKPTNLDLAGLEPFCRFAVIRKYGDLVAWETPTVGFHPDFNRARIYCRHRDAQHTVDVYRNSWKRFPEGTIYAFGEEPGYCPEYAVVKVWIRSGAIISESEPERFDRLLAAQQHYFDLARRFFENNLDQAARSRFRLYQVTGSEATRFDFEPGSYVAIMKDGCLFYGIDSSDEATMFRSKINSGEVPYGRWEVYIPPDSNSDGDHKED